MEPDCMIRDGQGDLFDADVDALVNTVNTVGVMGKGIALQFKRRFPEMFKNYELRAKRGELSLGQMHVWEIGEVAGPRFVINFPTKGHWRSRSRLTDIERGLDDLAVVIKERAIESIAVPPLGCGNGGLDWSDVEPVIRQKLGCLDGVDVVLYPPAGSPLAAEMRQEGQRPVMTFGQAVLVTLLARYNDVTLDASLIETQKLMYFLQEAGEPLRLRFDANRYGPYADNLRVVLREIEGHFLSGFGDGSATVHQAEHLDVMAGARAEAESLLHHHGDTLQRLNRVLGLVEGFESPYSLELLATVHWVMTHPSRSSDDDDQAVIDAVRRWSPRKGRMFSARHVQTAIDALRDRGWAPMPVGASR